MRKISILISTMLIMSILLAGCGPTADEDVQGETPEVIKIGVFEPLTGANAAGGELEKMGIDLAHKLYPTFKINGKDVPVELKYEDNKSDKQESSNAARKLVDSFGANIVLGSWGSNNAIAAGPIFKDSEIPAIGTSCTNPLVTLGNDYYFRVCYIDPFQGAVMAKYALNEGGYKKVAIIQEISNDYSVSLVDIFQKNFKKITDDDDSITSVSNYTTGDQDFTAQLMAISNTDAEAIFFPGNVTESALIMKQARALGINLPFLGADTWETPELIEIAGASAEGIVYTSFYDPAAILTETTNVFAKAFEKEYGKDEQIAGATALSFDAYLLAKATIEKAGTLDGPTLRDTLAKTQDFEGATGFITLNENGDAVKPAVIKTIQDGKFVYKSLVEPF